MGLLRSAARASISTTSGLATPEKWLVNWLKGGEDSAAGVNVDVDAALTYGPFFAGLRVLSEDASSLPLHLYERLEPRGKRRATEHPLHRVLHDAPNPLMTSMQLRETAMGHALTWGDGLMEVVRRRGEVVELWPLRPDRTEIEVVRLGAGRFRLRYRYRDEVNGIHAVLLPDQVLHVAGLGFDGVRGYSVVSLARHEIGLGIATQRFGSRFFANGSRPSGVLQSPKAVSDEARDRMRKGWETLHRGLDNAQRIAILEEGVTWQAMGIPPEDAQFLGTRKLQVTELARYLRVPPHKLGDLERATFSNIEHQSLDYVTSSLRPWLVRWEQAIWQRLLNSEERARFFAEHLVDGLLRGDLKSRYDAYAVGRNWGWLSGDDVREIENMNPLPDGQGEVYLVPLNMVDAATLASDDPEDEEALAAARARAGLRSAEGRRRIAQAFAPLIEDLDGRMAKLERAEVSSLVRRHLEDRSRSSSAFLAAVEELYGGLITERATERWMPLMTTFATEIAAAAAADVGGEPPDLARWVQRYVQSHVSYRSKSAIGQLRAVVEDADPQEAAEAATGQLDEWVEERPARTARWESIALSAAVARETWRTVGVRKLRWVAVGGQCPACSELDGSVVGIDSVFVEAGGSVEQVQADRPTFHPPLHPGCDCELVPD